MNKELQHLLTMAAKAARLKVKIWDGHTGTLCAIDDCRHGEMWMPHADDGANRRLEVALDMCVSQWPRHTTPDVMVGYCTSPGVGANLTEAYADHGGDACAATRWAVLRAAAAIGEAMP